MKHRGMVIAALVLVLASTIVIASTTVMIDHSRFLRVYLSSEVTVDGRAEFDVPEIVGELQSRQQQETLIVFKYEESIVLLPCDSIYKTNWANTSTTIDYGYFEGESYNRYLDISNLAIHMAWQSTSGNLTTKYGMGISVSTSEGTVIWEFHNDTWTFGWRWENYYWESRTQDHYLYEIRMWGYILLGGISGSLLFQITVRAFEKRKRKNKITTSRSVLG